MRVGMPWCYIKIYTLYLLILYSSQWVCIKEWFVYPYTCTHVALEVKNLPANVEDMRCGSSPWVGKISRRRKWQPTLAWIIPQTEKPVGLQYRVSKSWVWLKQLSTHTRIKRMVSPSAFYYHRNPLCFILWMLKL